jgi:hypothetical protein
MTPTTPSSRTAQSLAQLLPGLKDGKDLARNLDDRAGARVVADARVAMLDREGTEAAQLDPVPPGQGGCDLFEDGGDDPLHIVAIEIRTDFADPKDEFGFGIEMSPTDAGIGASGLSISSSCQSHFTASRVSVSDRTIFGPRPTPANAATPCPSGLDLHTRVERARRQFAHGLPQLRPASWRRRCGRFWCIRPAPCS